ncbi:MAG: crossover junction endodeoxyribonuclease RuvC [Candidatus Marinamargulisbacteria bacterium]|jgi:crossover junction endodeoxyribonuclease RuvC|nr:crossover junction endodeoxyribonuclease RuvC [bacterium]MBD97641.1 crossover junction endodeoxyribonuclease RuvC [bacterium]MDG2264623.1 crossover junction endodeoxyribonuclease RuvC [Candidatus Marinamargulisbacteria bacterium]|tara:strand:- start:2989 stop:3462 length:474 start_codon:yes stop_codon:yes gene_type:complete
MTVMLGIDPGLAITGFGFVEQVSGTLNPITWGAITTPANTPLGERLATIYADLTALIHRYKPTHMAVESLFFNTNVRTAFLVGQARGIMLLAGQQAGLPVADYTPLQVKQGVTGYGGADKKQVQYMVQQLLRLPQIPKPDDVADALAVAVCGLTAVR